MVKCDVCSEIREVRKDSYSAVCHSCSSKGRYPTEKTRQKMSDAKKGSAPTDATRKKMSEARKGEKHPMFGKSHSEEVRRKISDAKKGKSLSLETCRKMSEAKKGETNPNFGKPLPLETRKKLRDAMKGANNPNWKGGKSFEPYCHKFNNQFKLYIRDKFNNVCYLCGKTEEANRQKLSIHHVNYDKSCGCAETKEDRKTEDTTCQFVPLCVSCNTKVNKDRDKWERYFMAKMRNKLNGWYI